MSIRIITDSTCDIPAAEGQKLGIKIIPLTVSFGDQSFKDGVDLTPTMFYSMLKTSKVMPTTSQISVGAFIDAFNDPDIRADDDILVITISSKLSGTYQSACIAKNSVEHKSITIIDSQSVTYGLALLVRHAAKLRDMGLPLSEIAQQIETVKTRVRIYATFATLKYLHKGGRLSGAGAIAGTVLGIKPVIEVRNGEIVVASKQKGSKAAYRWIGEQIKLHGVADHTTPYFLKADAEKEIEEFMGEVGRISPIPNAAVKDIGVTVGTHVGNGGVGVAFFAKK